MKVCFGGFSFGSAALHIGTPRWCHHTGPRPPPPRSPSLHRRPPCIGIPKIWSAGASIKGSQDLVSQQTRLQSKPTYARPGRYLRRCLHMQLRGSSLTVYSILGAGTAYKLRDGKTAKAATKCDIRCIDHYTFLLYRDFAVRCQM
jgi:hypothetical protein